MAIVGPEERMAELLAHTLTDDAFRKRLLSQPEEALRAEGISLPPRVKVKVLENTSDLLHIVLPAKEEALPEEALEQVTGGGRIGKPGTESNKGGEPCSNKSCQYKFGSGNCVINYMTTAGACRDLWQGP